MRGRLLAGELEVAVYALPGEEVDERTHALPLFMEQMAIAVHRGHRLANQGAFPVKELDGENYIHRTNCEFAGYADHILQEKRGDLHTGLLERARRLDVGHGRRWPGFRFHAHQRDQPCGCRCIASRRTEFWRRVDLVTVRGRPYSPGAGALVREAMQKKWFGNYAIALNFYRTKNKAVAGFAK